MRIPSLQSLLVRRMAPADPGEIEQLIVRVVYVSANALAVTLVGGWSVGTLMVVSFFALGTFAHAWHMRRSPARSAQRRTLGALLDQSGTTVTTGLLGPDYAACYFMIGSISVGYGLRFGPRYGLISAGYSSAVLLCFVQFLPAFAAAASWIYSTLLCVGVMPLYAAYLTAHLRRQEEASRQEAIRLQHAASHDPKTGLLNHAAFVERVDRLLSERAGRRHALAVLFLDLDRFKQVNDSMGHAAGDELLVRVARTLEQSVREADVVARLGGDEFAVLLHEVLRPEEVPEVVAALQNRLRRAITVAEAGLGVGMSIGAAVYNGETPCPDAAALIAQADAAMYTAKSVNHMRHEAALPNG